MISLAAVGFFAAIGFFAAGFFLALGFAVVVVVVVVVVVDVFGVAAVCANNGAETINRRILASQDLIVSLPLYLNAAGPGFTDGGFRALGSRLSPATAEQVLSHRLGCWKKLVLQTFPPDLACALSVGLPERYKEPALSCERNSSLRRWCEFVRLEFPQQYRK
ncbi:MAG: hypothetical protein WCC59_19890 [Terriglobales bacterium]